MPRTPLLLGAGLFGSLILLSVLASPAADPPVGKPAGGDIALQRINRLIAQLGADRFADREEASRQLVAVGPPALDALRRAAAGGDRDIGRRATACIKEIEANVVVARWVAKLRSPDPEERCRAANELMRIGPPAKAAVPALTRALGDPDKDVAKRAVVALAFIGSQARPAVPALVAILKDTGADKELRWTVATQLGRITARAPDAVAVLLDMLEHGSELLRNGAAFGLGDLGRDDSRVVPALLRALRTSRGTTLAVVARALGALRPDRREVGPALVEALKANERRPASKDKAAAREGILLALVRFPSDFPEAVPVLIAVLKDPNEDDRAKRDALYALEAIGPPARDAVPLLKNLARTGPCAFQAASALRSIEGRPR